MGKKQLPYLSALSPEVTAAFSGGVDLSTTVLVLDGCPMFAPTAAPTKTANRLVASPFPLRVHLA
jgi:predicted PP-loop superfamily ATPase